MHLNLRLMGHTSEIVGNPTRVQAFESKNRPLEFRTNNDFEIVNGVKSRKNNADYSKQKLYCIM